MTEFYMDLSYDKLHKIEIKLSQSIRKKSKLDYQRINFVKDIGLFLLEFKSL